MWESSSPLISPRTLEARDKRTRARVHQREGHQQRFAFGPPARTLELCIVGDIVLVLASADQSVGRQAVCLLCSSGTSCVRALWDVSPHAPVCARSRMRIAGRACTGSLSTQSNACYTYTATYTGSCE